jgi:large subunit ribosomal protein L35
MNKRKVRKSILNRFKITKKGKVMRRQAFRRHLKSSKTSKRLRNLKKIKEIKGYYAKKIKKAVGKRTRVSNAKKANDK